VYWNDDGKQLVLVLRLVWDNPADAEDFHKAFKTYIRTWSSTGEASEPAQGLNCRTDGDELLCVQLEGETQTLVVRAPNASIAETLVEFVNSH
jgi:hypothetical protein